LLHSWLLAASDMTEFEKRVRALKDAYIAAHRQAPIALYLTPADELALQQDPPSFIAPDLADKIVEGKVSVRDRLRKFAGLQIVWDATRTRVE
jgi:hypothetical protein